MKAINGFFIVISGPDDPNETLVQEVEEILSGRVLGDAEDILNDALPDGYQAKITEAKLLR